MESRAKILGHPVHQILVMFPIGMFGFAVVCDAAKALTTTRRSKGLWAEAARRAIAAGLVGTGIAAPFGLLDYVAIPNGTRAKTIGRVHGLGNVAVIGLFAASWLVRSAGRPRLGAALATGGIALVSATAWLGTELINRLGIGVYEPTSFDAPSSLQHRLVEIDTSRRRRRAKRDHRPNGGG
jgi:uncharacterized membrane protein